MTPDDEKFLRRAVELASKAGASGERPFGSLLVGDDQQKIRVLAHW